MAVMTSSVRLAGEQSSGSFSDTPSTSQIDLVKGMMDCLYAECTPCICDCVMAELEKLGQKYRVALKIAKVCWWSWCETLA